MSESTISGRIRIARIFKSYNMLITLIIALAVGHILPDAALAQADTTAREQPRSDSTARMLEERLGLTDEQADEIASILEKRNRSKAELEKKYGSNDETDRLSLMIETRRLDQETDQRIAQLLDEEQIKAYKEYQNEVESLEKRKLANAYASDNPRFRELAERLTLTDEQAADVYPILEDAARQMRELVLEARGQGRQGMNTMRDRMEELNATTENRLSRILDERQMTEYKRYMEEQRSKMRD